MSSEQKAQGTGGIDLFILKGRVDGMPHSEARKMEDDVHVAK